MRKDIPTDIDPRLADAAARPDTAPRPAEKAPDVRAFGVPIRTARPQPADTRKAR